MKMFERGELLQGERKILESKFTDLITSRKELFILKNFFQEKNHLFPDSKKIDIFLLL